MRVVILDTADAVNRRAASLFTSLLAAKPSCVLGLATGGTPLGLYRLLIEAFLEGKLSFREASTFNLDEYVGLAPEHPQSYHYFMQSQLLGRVDLNPERCHLPDGMAKNLVAECRRYETLIANSGGIDLQLLGIGSDGHVAFNEPGSSLASRTRVKALTQQTRQDNARFFSSLDEVPKLSITMGVGTILESRQILLMATGAKKSAAVRAFVEGPVTAQVPASALQLHPNVTVLLDQEAANGLQRRDYYQEVETIQLELERGLLDR